MRAVDAVLFDLDGTLVDTMSRAPQAYADTVRSLGGPDLSAADVAAAWHIGPTAVVLAHFLARPVDAHDLACFGQRFEAAMEGVRPFAGVVALLDALERAGLGLAIVTTATRWAADLMLTNSGLGGRFAGVIGGDDVDAPKPAADGLVLACTQLGVSPERAAYVGDAAVDVECAGSAGSLAIHAAWGGGVLPPGNHLVAHRPQDVVALVDRARGPATG
jgi:HAD superfamily hydrolase (TIGR01549 family)